jgi:DNA-binding response OmpR family regulator
MGDRGRILVITDDRGDGGFVQAILAGAGFSVGLVRNDEVTLEQIEVGAPGLVVLDARVPLIADWPILGRLVHGHHRPPILLLSGACVPVSSLAAFTLAVSGHISKPFSAQALIARCERLLARAGVDASPQPAPRLERRKEPRRAFLGQVTVLTERGHPTVSGEIYDISAGGARIELGPVPATAFPPGSRLRLSVGLPLGFEPLELEASIEWCRDEAVGVSFEDLPTEARQRLRTRLAQAFPHRGTP